MSDAAGTLEPPRLTPHVPLRRIEIVVNPRSGGVGPRAAQECERLIQGLPTVIANSLVKGSLTADTGKNGTTRISTSAGCSEIVQNFVVQVARPRRNPSVIESSAYHLA